MNQTRTDQHVGAIQLIEEAIYLLRQAPGTLLPCYYLGTLPFILGFLFFWGDMSRSANAQQYCAVAALGLALLFVWMKCWQAVFIQQVKHRISGRPATPWTLRRITTVAASQTLVHSTGFIILPLAGLMVIPFGWCFAFFQNVSVLADPELKGSKTICKSAWLQARLWPQQNHILVMILSGFGVLVLVNLAIAIYMLPHLLKTFLGIDSIFTLSGLNVINTTFWATTFGFTYLCLDPIVKTIYALRCFYGEALHSGEDLKADLRRYHQGAVKILTTLVVFIFCGMALNTMAAEKPSVAPDTLNLSIEEVLSQREFAWRMPREKVQPDKQKSKGPVTAVVDWILQTLSKGIRALKNMISSFFEWLDGLLPRRETKPEDSDTNWIGPARVLIGSLLVILLGFLAFVFWRFWKRHHELPQNSISAQALPIPDLKDERVTADELPADRWLTLAKAFVEKGELVLAMRALYLATLARLAKRELITIEIYKSNREYERELNRRAHAMHDLLSDFAKILNVFEGAWYGMHRVTPVDFDKYAVIQKRIMAIAEK